MSRIICFTLLLIILLNNVHDSTASAVEIHVSKEHIRRCGCRVFPNGKIRCRSAQFRAKPVEKQDLVKCFCSKTNQHKFPEFRAACAPVRPFQSTPL